MTIYQQTLESGTDGVAPTTGNSAGGGTPVSVAVTGGGTVLYTTTSPIDGSVSVAWSAPSGLTARLQMAMPDVRAVGTFAKHRLNAVTVDTQIHGVRNATTRMATVALKTDGRVKVSSSNADLYTTPNALTLPGVYWVDVMVDGGTSTADGKVKFALFDSAGAFAGGMTDYVEYTARNTGGGANASTLWLGGIGTEAIARSGTVDTIRAIDSYSSAFPVTTTVAPPSAVNASTGWTATGGTVLAVLSDASTATYVTSTDNPTSVVLDLQAPRLAPPSGNFTVQVDARRLGSTSGTLVAKLYDGTTLRATVTGVAVPATTFGAANITFLAANITAVTGWTTGVRVVIEATAA
jgi:hypothetical protein